MLHTILSATDNNERRRAEAATTRALHLTPNLMLLVHVVRDVANVSAGVRQLAAVLLRKRISSLWQAISTELRVELKGILLQQLGLEPVRVVRFAVAHLVTRLARADALDSRDGWPELLQAIRAAVEDPRGDMRELAMVLAYSMAEVMAECGGFSALIVEAVFQGMADTEVCVQRAALKAMGALLLCVDLYEADGAEGLGKKKQQQEQLLQRLVPRCLELLAVYGAVAERTAVCVDVLDLLEQLLGDLSAKKHAELLRTLACEVMSVLVNRANQARVRQNSSELLVTLVNLKPKFVAGALLEPMVAACVQVMGEDGTISLPEVAHVEETDEDGLNTDEDTEMLHVNTPCMYGGRLLSTLATKLSSKSFTSALLPFISRISDNLQADPLERKAAIISLACLAEGNPGYLRRRIGYVLKLTQDFLNDGSPVLREAAAFSLTYFCSHLQPEILTHHQQLFPMLLPLLRDDADGVRRRVAGALDALCENVAEDVEPYVPLVLPAVLEAIGRSSLETQKELCGVISSLAATRSPSFRAHGAHCLELLKGPLTINSPETVLLRAKATEAVGIVANAIGKEAFLPFLSFFIQHVAENFTTRQAELREESFGFMSNLCEMLREDFIPYLNDSINCALQTINEDRVHYENKHLLSEGGMSDVKIGGEDDEDGEEEAQTESEAEDIHARVRTADVEEKCSAVYFIGVCAEVLLGKLGVSWIDACWAALDDLSTYFHNSVQCEILTALAKLAKAAHGSEHVVKSASEDTLTPYARGFLDTLVNDRLLACFDETDKEVVASACSAFVLLLDFFGPQTFSTGPDSFLQHVTELLQQRTPCQRNDDDDDDDDDGDDKPTSTGGKDVNLSEDHDDVLMDTVCDMVESFAKAHGPAFKAYSDAILPLLLRYTDDDRPSEDVVMATGCIATIMEAMGGAAEPYLDHAIRLALHLIEMTDESSVKANCAYLIRVFVENFLGHFNNASSAALLLQALWGIAGSQEEIPAAVDNAVSATCSMVRCLAPSVVPLISVVPPLLERIPMRVDRAENANAIRTILHLLTSEREFVLSHCWMMMVRCIATVLAALTVDDEQKQLLVVQGVTPLLAEYGGQWREASAQLPTDLRAALERYGC